MVRTTEIDDPTKRPGKINLVHKNIPKKLRAIRCVLSAQTLNCMQTTRDLAKHYSSERIIWSPFHCRNPEASKWDYWKWALHTRVPTVWSQKRVWQLRWLYQRTVENLFCSAYRGCQKVYPIGFVLCNFSSDLRYPVISTWTGFVYQLSFLYRG